MIHEEKSYSLTCDNCGKAYDNGFPGRSVYINDSNMLEAAVEDNWYQDNDKHYCSDCWSFDEDENLALRTFP